jgi:hypothetical protein
MESATMSTLNKGIVRSLGFAAGLLAAGVAHAVGPTGGDTFNLITDYGTTGDVTVLGSVDFPATSVYTPGAGDCPLTGCTSADDLIGDTVGFSDDGSGVINTITVGNVPTAPALNYGVDWNLTLDYHIEGTAEFIDCIQCVANPAFIPDGTLDSNTDGNIDTALLGIDGVAAPFTIRGTDALVPDFDTAGASIIDIYYNDLLNPGSTNDGVQVLQLVLTDFELDAATVILFTEADYSFCAPTCSTYVQDFFTFTTPVSLNGNDYDSFYEIWLAGETFAVPFNVVAVTDFNVTPNAVPVCVAAGEDDCATLQRSTDLNVSTRFFAPVPEPGILALFSTGLLALGFMVRRRRIR